MLRQMCSPQLNDHEHQFLSEFLDKLQDIITFRIAAGNTINFATLLSRVAGVINTFQSVVPLTATQL